ncbi:iron complex outermembrane recepter protein [Cupriavidus metallidurans]|jgi:iron complex outermembrane receptor protein|uniref:TonB-dependent receptor n=1 Tax=Cupriavidus TaxID=106589 RepID=UPI000493283A|nr:TonB-dependent receptor [Cupriavidus metallidurans]
MAALAAAVLMSMAVAPVAAQTPRGDVPIHIEAQPLADALLQLGRQTSLQLYFPPELVTGKRAPAVNGTMRPEAALDSLLKGSGIQYQRSGNQGFVLRPVSAAPAAAPPVPSNTLHATAQPTTVLAAVEVTASRTSSDLVRPTRQSTVLERTELEELKTGSDSLATVLSKVIPGMADSSHTVTDFGQTLRGRGMLVLLDGIPLNTNRDSARNLANIDPALVERVEVLRGSSAIYGGGATGGIVSITTRPAGGEPKADTTVTMSTPLSRLRADGLSANVQQHFSGSSGMLDYAFDLGARHIGNSYDAKGQRIAPEPSQGDLFDSNNYNVGGKLGLRFAPDQRIQLAFSHFDAKQDTRWASDPSVAKLPPGSVPARALDGLQLADQNQIRNTLVNLEYEHRDLLGSQLSAQFYYRNYYSRFTPFDARAVPVRGGNVDQAMQDSEVFGSRLTVKTPLGADKRTRVIWGMDFEQETSDMPIDIFDLKAYDASGGRIFNKIGTLTYMPPITTRSIGGFAQLQHKFNEQWSTEGGLRYQYARASFSDFVPLSQSRVTNPATVSGGAVDYSAVLGNIGVAYKPVKDHEFYAAFSQGFNLPDIGLQVRNARAGFDIGSSDLQPVKTNNYELGWRGAFGNTLGSLAIFYTTSDLGDVQSFNNGLILTRTAEKIYGVEASADYLSTDERWGAGGTFTWMQGRETPQGRDSQQMTGYRIPPLKLTGYVQYRPVPQWNNRLQATFFAGYDYRLNGVTSFGRRDVSSYTTLDLISSYQVTKKDTLTVGIQNLLNRYYYPLYSQLLRNSNNTSHLPAAGITLTATYQHRW